MHIFSMLALFSDVKENLRKKHEGILNMQAGMVAFPGGNGTLSLMCFFGAKPRNK